MLLLLASSSVAAPELFTPDGKRLGRVQGKYAQPKVITGSVTLVAGTGTVSLNESRRQGVTTTVPLDKNSMVVTLSPKAASPANRYGWTYDSSQKAVVISSSLNTDTVTVSYQIVVR